jgi:Uma2 family endonuclease
MATGTLISEDEYLRTSYEGPDPEYRDGELVDRGMPTYLHGMIQAVLASLFLPYRKSNDLWPSTEARHRVRSGLVRIPDVAVQRGKPTMSHPDHPPYVAIEVLSPDDRMGDVTSKLREYRDFGVPHAWVVDPVSQALYVYDSDGLHQVRSLQIPEFGINFTPEQIFEA